MIIDAHCHIYPDKIADKAAKNIGSFYSTTTAYDGRTSTLLENGSEAGIDKFIVHSVATTPKQVSSINNFISEEIKAHPDKLYGFGALHPDSVDVQSDIEELIELKLQGVKLHPDIQNVAVDDPKYIKIFELCEKYNLPVLLHTGDKRYDFSNPNRLIPILDRFQNITFVGAHFGCWSNWYEASKLMNKYKNFYVDCSSSFYALTDNQIREIIANYGIDRVIFGTDYPMWNMETELKRFLSLGYDKDSADKILYKNAINIYRLNL
jgi:hypothetical protein